MFCFMFFYLIFSYFFSFVHSISQQGFRHRKKTRLPLADSHVLRYFCTCFTSFLFLRGETSGWKVKLLLQRKWKLSTRLRTLRNILLDRLSADAQLQRGGTCIAIHTHGLHAAFCKCRGYIQEPPNFSPDFFLISAVQFYFRNLILTEQRN